MSIREDSTLADLAAHEHASDLEAALDYAMVADRRAPAAGVDRVTSARLRLATSGIRTAFYAGTRSIRTLAIHDAHRHLEAALDGIETDHVGHPTRHALQFLKTVQDGDAG